MKKFCLFREVDETGVSGTGRVAEGIIFSNGWCAMTWLTENTSVAFYPDIKTLESIHGHHGHTKIIYED
jgi:hypothetical protein